MKAQHLILVSLLIMFASTQLIPIKTEEEEIKIDLNLEEKLEIQGNDIKQNKLYDKLYEIDKEAYDQIKNTFKNVVHLIFEKNEEETQVKLLNSIIQNVNFTKIDVIFVKSPIGLIESEKGIVIKNFDKMIWIRNFDNLQSQIFDIISPKLEFLQTEDDVDEYFNQNKLNSLVLLPDNYTFRTQIIEDLETLIRNGDLKEARINGLKAFNSNYKNFTAPTLILHKGNNKFEQYEYNLTYTDQILDFFYLESLDLINRLDEDNYARVFGGSIQTQVHLLINGILNQDLFNAYYQVAQNNKNNDLKYHRLIFTYSTFDENPTLWSQFDFDQSTNTPKLVITETNFRKYQLQKYICQSETLNQENIQQFIDDFRNKNLNEFYKSEPIPQQTENQDIYKIVGQTFSQEVLNKGKNVLLLFWDSKNKDLFDDYFKLLDQFSLIQNKEKIKIGHIDLANNEHPKITVDSVPKLMLYLAADKKAPKEYLKSSNLVISELKAWLDYYIGDSIAYKQEKTDL
ncbi:unnamed protein product [Paramecium pentaurelia]|uniref:protein disulfide-isomerase n=1 Tax=Paramecium pentaurelia TaxID=43138 RepID=A0A8S1VAF5_9CILI|nr:unnamed protein product [Paramecium pentaurelia]